MKQWILNILISLDQLLNTLLGGDPDETISSRCGKRVETSKICCILCWMLDKIDPRHCHRSVEIDEGKDSLEGK